jgi:Tfp pilus assembly protein PilX
MTRLLNRARGEEGYAMVMVLALLGLMGLLSTTMMATIQHGSASVHAAVVEDSAFHAAEAGTSEYIAKLVSDRLYYTHYVHPGEASRTDGATSATAGQPWSGTLNWTYPNGKDTWRPLNDGYEYSLQITPPSAATPYIRIVTTARPIGSTDPKQWAVVETLVRPSSVSDFQMLANADISYGATATTYGKIYAGIDSAGVRHSVNHAGQAYGNIYAENAITGSPTLRNGALTYDRTTIRTQLKNPVNFNDFLTSLVDIQRASQVGGIYLNNPAVDGWTLLFQADGSVLISACTRRSGADIAAAAPNCGTAVRYMVPSNGAIYTAQSSIVSGQVNGRVTVASNGSIVVGNNISYVLTGDDVLGLVAANDVIVAAWVPTNLDWRAATISQTGNWRSWNNTATHGTMTFTGSTTTNRGGHMSQFAARVYQYDPSLQYLQPPWFPTIEDAYTILMSRELPATP